MGIRRFFLHFVGCIMSLKKYDLVVIGAGPAGEVGAIRAAQLGMKVALVEKNEHLGGTCLNWGCIPTKALIESAKVWTKINHLEDQGFSVGTPEYSWSKIMGRKEKIVGAQRKGLKFLMKKNKLDVYHGTASFKAPHVLGNKGSDTDESIEAKHILLATGSRVKELGFAPSNGKNILTSDTILSIDRVPKSLAVVGGGVVGMEFASLFGRFGSKVTVIELMPQALPFEDPECVKEVVRSFKKQNVVVETGSKLTGVKDNGQSCTVSVEGKDDRDFEVVLMSIGREPVLDNLELGRIGVSLDERGFVKVDAHYQTSVPHIFAVGDILSTPALAHTASAEAKHAVEVIAGHVPPVINYETNPSAVYTYPEVASIGLKEDILKEKGIEYGVAKFPFAPLAKAKIEDATEGFIKILYDVKYKEILGVHIVGAKATELISEFVLGKLLETTIDEIGQAIHPHPTISETIMEAAHVAEGGAIHL